MSKVADMSKHVLGPWRYVRSGYGHSRDFDIVSVKSGGRIASTPYENIAALIARAPDLLEENERLRAALEEHAEQVFAILCSDYSGSLTERMEKAMVHVMAWRAALKLAKGEA